MVVALRSKEHIALARCTSGLAVSNPARFTDLSPPTSAEVKNAWSYASIPPLRLRGVVLN